MPGLVLIARDALEYSLGTELADRFRSAGVQVTVYDKRVPSAMGGGFREKYIASKRTLVVMVRGRREFQTCKPSAHYQLPLVSGCPGLCEYCYLNTNLGHAPHVRVYVNTDEIFRQAEDYVRVRQPDTTIFEGSATSDPVAVETWTGSLAKAVAFFAATEGAGFRFATKYTDIEGLLAVEHRGKTEIRFSINCEHVINAYEHGAPPLERRIKAAADAVRAGYPIGFLIAPIFQFDGWREQYGELLATLAAVLPAEAFGASEKPLTFELITHRFTSRAKSIIEQAYPASSLPMDETERRFKYGQFGYGKYVYPNEAMEEMRRFFEDGVARAFPGAGILYFV